MANGGYIHTTTRAPKYSPKVMKQMEGAYKYGLGGLMQQQPGVELPDMPGRVDVPQARSTFGLPGMPNVRDIQPTQLPAVPQAQPLPDMPGQPEFSSMDFGPIEEQARAGFQQQTLPTIAERFTTMGAGARGTGAFARTVGAAGAGLEGSLAALKAKMLPQWEMQKAQYGLQRGALGMQRGRLGLEQQLGLGKLGMERAGLGQREQQMRMQRDLGLGGLAMQRGRLGLEHELGMGRLGIQGAQARIQQELGLGKLGMERAGLQQKQQQMRTQQLLGLLGFKPPQMYGQPQTSQYAWGSYAQ